MTQEAVVHAETAVHVASKTRAGMARIPRHHVFPIEERAWFEEHGFVGEWDIDQFTVQMDQGMHQAIHGGADFRLGREVSQAKSTGELSGSPVTPQLQAELDGWAGEWNTQVMDDLRKAEARVRLQRGRDLTREEVFEVVERTMARFGVEPNYIPYRSP